MHSAKRRHSPAAMASQEQRRPQESLQAAHRKPYLQSLCYPLLLALLEPLAAVELLDEDLNSPYLSS